MEFNLADLYESVAAAVPEREALVCGQRRLTYAQLDERANRLAHHFVACGIGAGDHVGLYLYNCTEYIEASLAAYKVRAVPINVNYRYVEEELAYLFDNADLKCLVYHREFSDKVAAVAASVNTLEVFVVVDDGSGADSAGLSPAVYDEALAASSGGGDFPERSADDIYILYTGGTTGMPKGVVWHHEDIFFGAFGGGSPMGEPVETPAQLAVAAREKPMQMTMLPVAPLMHGAAQWATFMGLYGGDKIILTAGHRFDPHEVWTLVETEKVQSLAIVGDAMARPLAEALSEDGHSYDISSLVVLGSGGAILSAAVKEEIRQHLPSIMVFDSFGVSETGMQGRGVESSGGPGPRFAVSPDTYVLDEDYRPVVPGSGQIGRLARSGHIPLGYYKDQEKTAETFVVANGVRYSLPGDMATVEEDGVITLLGRGSVCINSGGEKIFPEEVEAVLKAHPEVFDVVVVGVSDERWGQKVAAVVAPRSGCEPTLDSLADHCRTRLAGYKVPRQLHLVAEVLRSPSGKPDYRWARDTAEASPA
ncbi:MAG: acyl-CoA synthetase [Deltaproteobacteria bacterium]